jgi:3-deoxy-D-manno-octulosonic-acid transferase
MLNFYDIAYGLGVLIASPVWLVKRAMREKVLRAIAMRMGHVPERDSESLAVFIHAVSLGEVNATSALVAQLQQARPDLDVIISTTTVTGYDRARQLYGQKAGSTLVRFPLDFSMAINRLLNAVRPSVVVLMEGEIWPNFLLQCDRRKIPVLLINGRITQPAFQRYKRIAPITARMLRRIAMLCAQDKIYAERFLALGASADRVSITGTMKFDTARLADHVEGDDQLAIELGLDRTAGPIWVCGSTGPGEEVLILDVYRMLLKQFPKLTLVIVPRKPERFDEVAKLIQGRGFQLLRRSERRAAMTGDPPVILGDTMGELRKFYSLATVVFVGRSLVDLGPRQHGSDMIEPAALAKPVVIGPWTQNFAEAVRMFLAAHAMREVQSSATLTETIGEWLIDPAAVIETGRRAQQVVRENQGATQKHLQQILRFLPSQSPK